MLKKEGACPLVVENLKHKTISAFSQIWKVTCFSYLIMTLYTTENGIQVLTYFLPPHKTAAALTTLSGV
jgi:hypothetical protein